jgi:ribosomal protein S18 acetylase RimI-like enzyme
MDEFNLGMLAGPDGPEALPAAELVFRDYPAGKPKIVGYPAKWDAGSFEYLNTIRHFADVPADAPLLEEMRRLARQCWSVFGLAGVARVDFRVDAQNRPWILEINANPCLSPDSGFAAMLKQAGIPFDRAVSRLLADAQTRARRTVQPTPVPLPAPPPSNDPVTFRHELVPVDRAQIRDLVHATGFFHAEEVDLAVELVDEWLAKGASSGYEFVIAEQDGRIVGYTCFGLIPCTQSSYDLYWIAVHPKAQGQGLGRRLNAETERRIRERSGTRIYAETSSRPQYRSTRAFYERTGYRLAEMLEDFYAPGDGRATYLKVL